MIQPPLAEIRVHQSQTSSDCQRRSICFYSRGNTDRPLDIHPITITPSREEFLTLAKRANFVPVIVDLVADAETPVSAFAKVDNGEPCFLFESAEKNEESGRFSFIGFDPLLIFKSIGSTVAITESGETKSFATNTDPLAELEKVMARFQFVAPPDIPHFVAGAVGFIAYDVVRFFEPSVLIHPRDDLRLPEMMFMIARTVLIFDHRFRKLRLVANAYIDRSTSPEAAYDRAEHDLRAAIEKLARPVALRPINAQPLAKPAAANSNTSRAEFESMVTEAKELIAAGDIFQVVLSQRFETEFAGDAFDLYRALRFGNPSPYMFYLKFGNDFTALGSSPELHVRVRDGLAEIRPIAGTRPRGENLAEDERLARELILDPKERAEHVMLIDLGRNDLGRVAEFGSVKVTEQMVIERYSHVMHIVSHVVARLRQDKNAFDAMRATFPAGTVSGAPKIRAMQIVTDLEKSRRGFYAGIVGYFGFDGGLDSCIALRSIVLKNGKAYFQTGAGVVADSDPAREFDETVNKAKAMFEAITRAK
jgi:anthranilate synthase component 1